MKLKDGKEKEATPPTNRCVIQLTTRGIDESFKKKKDSSTRSVDESDDEGIDLEGDISVKSEDFTFEFNDMRKTYTEGITVLLKKYIVNPTAAYEIASALTDQGIAFDDRANSVYSTILNYRINIINQK